MGSTVTESAAGPARSQPLITPDGITAALQQAVKQGYMPSVDSEVGLMQKPCALFYDLTSWEGGLHSCLDAFGPGCLHAIAFKANAVSSMMRKACELGLGAECASIGEVLHAQALGFPADSIVFDSPCKTRAEITWSVRHGIHINIDNMAELERLATSIEKGGLTPKGTIGLRINPLVGAGPLAAFSVATSESKFGVSVENADEIIEAYKKYPWLNGLHIHTGSAGMALKTLVAGVQVAVDFSKRVHTELGRKQIKVLDIGGGMPVNFKDDTVITDTCPSFAEYADTLRSVCPGLLASTNGSKDQEERLFEKVVTEFGQGLNAKGGFLASRVEYAKVTPNGEAQIDVVHYGADVCPRQFYTTEHKRRIEVYDGTSCKPKDGPTSLQHLAGPLCFQGDMLKGFQLPKVAVDDFIVMREAGSNMLSLFSRHCSRQAPLVLGFYRNEPGKDADVSAGSVEQKLTVLKAAEDFGDVVRFWGGEVPAELAEAVRQTQVPLPSHS